MIEFDEETIEKYAEEEPKPIKKLFAICCKVKDMDKELLKAICKCATWKDTNLK